MLSANTNTADQSGALITTNPGVLEKNAEYEFTIYTVGNIPKGGFFTLKVPQAVGLPSSDLSLMTFICQLNC